MSGFDSVVECLRGMDHRCLHLADAMNCAVKFDLGEYDLPTAPVDMRKACKPPFSSVLLQFDTSAGRQIVLWRGDDTYNGATVAGACRINGEAQWRVLLPRKIVDGNVEQLGDPSGEDVARHWAAMAINVFAVIGCSNIQYRDVCPDAALQRRRVQRGKPPLYTYKILVLNPNRVESKSDTIGGHHASPRVHLRRGHIRRLPAVNVWVQPCVVGNKKRGIVHKEYRVEATQ